MWYVIDAEKESQLISGFKEKISQGVFLQLLKNNRLPGVLNYEPVHAGDVFFMPAGRVHALGPGILMAEIQETSDTTYRIYDWDRKDDEGKSRDLHIDESLDAIDFSVQEKYRTEYPGKQEQSVTLASCEYFTTSLIQLEKHGLEKDYSALDSFVALLCIDGSAFIQHQNERYSLGKGELILIPAMLEGILINPLEKTKILEVHI
jgi:mannose-6-phosphate isomerase